MSSSPSILSPAASTHTLERPSRRLRLFSVVAALAWWTCVAATGLLLLAWLAIYVVIVPRIAEMRPLLESRLSAAWGAPVRIGNVNASVKRLMPTFELTQVRLQDARGQDALVLKKITAAVSPQSMLELGFEQLLIEQPELAVRRDAAGKITIAGLELSQAAAAATDTQVAADWLFTQNEVVIRGGTVRWTDELRNAPPLMLSNLDFYLRNSGRRHLVRVDATPSSAWGDRFSVSADLRSPLLGAHPGDWRGWQGQVFAHLPLVDVQELKRYSHLGIDVDQGRGALRAWLTLDRGAIREATLDAALANVNLRLRQDLAALEMAALSGRVMLAQSPASLSVRTQQLAFVLQDGLHWPGGNLSLQLEQRDLADQMRGEFVGDKLDLAALALISDRLPLDARLRDWLAATKPQGLVTQIGINWRGPIERPSAYAMQGQAQAITLQAIGSAAPRSLPSASGTKQSEQVERAFAWFPGVHKAQVKFKLDETSGQVQLRIEQGSLTLPGVFENPEIALDRFSTEMTWQRKGPHWQVDLSNLQFANRDAQGQAKAHWQTSDPAKSRSRSRFPGILDLSGTLTRADGAQVHRYLPVVLASQAREYVRDAVTQGQASNGSFKVKGDLHDMPFIDPARGEFRIAAQVNGASFNYAPHHNPSAGALPWPALTQIKGELIFERQSMQVKAASAEFAGASGLQVARLEALVPDITTTPIVSIQANVKGSATSMLELVNTSALQGISNRALAQASASGQTDLQLRLQLPVGELEHSRVQGTMTLAANDIQFTPDSPALQQARGQVLFHERGFALRGVSARALGGEVRIEGASRANAGPNEPSIALRAQGVFTAEGLSQAKELGFVSRIAEQTSGSAAYELGLSFRRGVPEVTISSNLRGLAMNLPFPLSKSAEAALDLRFEHSLVRESLASGRALQDQISLGLGSVASLHYLRDVSGSAPRVLRGRIGVGLSPDETIAANDNAGVAANINFAQLDIDAWERLLQSAGQASPQALAPAGSASLSISTQAYLPSTLAVRARELIFQGRTLNNVVIGGSREGGLWRANLDARELSGYMEYRQPSEGNSGRVFARLSRLNLGAAAASDIEAALDQQPTSIPALDIVIEDFELRGRRLGRVELEALNRDLAGLREWRLSRLRVTLAEAQLNASGNWALVGATQGEPRTARAQRRRTALSFKLDISDAGELLKRFGQDKVIARGKGSLEGQIAWLGAPWALDYSSMTGGFNIDVENGQFLKADPGIAKLLGVLSLQSLPRRLVLDFRDLFTEGFPFDFVRGDIKLDQGAALTNNLQMKGVNAAVLMEGSASIERETQDLKIVVVPEINAGTASLVASVINPVVGLSSFLAQLILRRPMIEAATQEFHVTGSWLDPQVTRVKRSPDSADKPSEPNNPSGAVQPRFGS